MNAKALTIYLGFYMHKIYLLQQKCTNPKKWEALRKLKGPHMILTAYLSTLSKKKRFRSMNAKASESIDNLSRILDAQDLSPSAKCSKQKKGGGCSKSHFT